MSTHYSFYYMYIGFVLLYMFNIVGQYCIICTGQFESMINWYVGVCYSFIVCFVLLLFFWFWVCCYCF